MMLAMRTTLTLDPDLAAQLKDLAHERGIPFKQAVNEVIRKGLTGSAIGRPVKLPSFDMGEPLMDLTKAAQLADMLDDERRIEQLENP